MKSFKQNILMKFFSILILLAFSSNSFAAADEGYFLSLLQKKQLIWWGAIKGDSGEWYNIWLSPGYVEPGRMSKKSLVKAKKHISKNLIKIHQNSSDSLEWAFKDCLYNFTIQETLEDWSDNYSHAKKRVKKRVFGWWLSYPWFVINSTFNSAVRIPLGLIGTTIGALHGIVLIPACYLTNATIGATWNFAVGAVFVPGTAALFNTAISLPMALLGQKPADPRVDGFWVTKMSEKQVQIMLNGNSIGI